MILRHLAERTTKVISLETGRGGFLLIKAAVLLPISSYQQRSLAFSFLHFSVDLRYLNKEKKSTGDMIGNESERKERPAKATSSTILGASTLTERNEEAN